MDGVDAMTDPDRQREEIEQNERWLGDVCEPAPQVATESLKRRLHLAIQEHWLAARLTEQAPPSLSARVRNAVRQTLAGAQRSASGQPPTVRPDRPGSGRRRWKRLRLAAWSGAGLSAAAALVFLMARGNQTASPETLDETTAFVASIADAQTDDVDFAIEELLDAFEQLDQALAQGWTAEDIDDEWSNIAPAEGEVTGSTGGDGA
jgi:hypothetical protein